MKKLILILLLGVIGGNFTLFAQQEREGRRSAPGKPKAEREVFAGRQGDEKKRESFEKFNAERKAFISEKMNLTEEEIAAFWPLSNELHKKKFELSKEVRSRMRILHKDKQEGKDMKEEDCKELLELSARLKVKEAELEEEYQKKFLKVIPAEKLIKYQHAEQEFARSKMFVSQGRNAKPGEKVFHPKADGE